MYRPHGHGGGRGYGGQRHSGQGHETPSYDTRNHSTQDYDNQSHQYEGYYCIESHPALTSHKPNSPQSSEKWPPPAPPNGPSICLRSPFFLQYLSHKLHQYPPTPRTLPQQLAGQATSAFAREREILFPGELANLQRTDGKFEWEGLVQLHVAIARLGLAERERARGGRGDLNEGGADMPNLGQHEFLHRMYASGRGRS